MADQPARLEAATIKAEIGSGIVYRFSNDAASEADIPTLSGDIPNLKNVILRIQNEGADKISFATKIFIDTDAGISGTSNQEIFLVQSNEPGEIYEVWQNVSGTAVDTGKRSISAAAVIEATEAATAAAASAQESADAATMRVARFLEPSATPPTQRDDGQPLQFGDRYLNTTDQIEYIYKDSGWVANNLDAQLLSTSQGASLIGAVMQDGSVGTVQQAIDEGDNSLRQELGAPDGASLVNGAVVSVKDAASLRALSGTKNTKAVVELGGNGALLNSLYYLDTNDITTVDDGGLVIASAEGPRWKLSFTDSIDIRIFPVASGGDITAQMNAAVMALYSVGGGTLHVRGDYTISGTVQMLPHVTIKGSGSGSSPRITYTGAGAAFETTRPAGWVANSCIDSHVLGLTMIGPGMATPSIGVSIRNAIQCSVKLNEIGLFGYGIAWNVGATSFENLEHAYFNVIEQNSIKPCGRGHAFYGAANRNTISTNNIADATVGYDFGLGFSVSETNTFLNENIEGCRSWAEWRGTIYSQTWVGITIENPASNGYVCEVKDPGRQVFLNLSIIPLGNDDAISMYSYAGATPSAVFGSAASSGTERLGIRLNEEVRIYDHIRYMANYGSTIFSGMIPANSIATTTITLASAKLNDMVSVGALRDLAGCTLQSWAEPGVVRVNIVNGTGANITIPETEIRAVVSKVG